MIPNKNNKTKETIVIFDTTNNATTKFCIICNRLREKLKT